MDRIKTTLALGLLGSGLMFGGGAWAQSAPDATQNPSAPKEQPSDESRVEAIRQYSVARREEAVAAAKSATMAIDRQMDALQAQVDAQWGHMSEQARAQSEAAMTDLRRRRTDAAEWYGGMRHGSADAWVEVRGGFAKSYRDLADSLRKARAQIRSSTAPKTKPVEPADPAKPAPAAS